MTSRYVLTTADAERWRAVLPTNAFVMGSVEYARVLEKLTGGAARLFVADWGQAAAAYPFLQRSVPAPPLAAGAGERWDTFTPEYSGPIFTRPPPPCDAGAPRFADLFAAYCREQGIVAEFAHLSPWTPPELLDESCVHPNREVVYIDLTWGEEEIWKRSLTTDARRQVKQAERAGVRVRRAASVEDVREFHRLYELTMARRNAADRYHFPLEYFVSFFETMPGNAFFALAEHHDRVIAGGLYFHDEREVVWHLSAADMAFSGIRPVNAYHYDTIRWAVRQGKRRMLCGGAYQPGDGVFRFKAGFSPLRAQFKTYRRVHDPASYAALTRAWSAQHGGRPPGGEFFPAYRSCAPGSSATPPEPSVATGALAS
jgi:serine/alanine adding enzyme